MEVNPNPSGPIRAAAIAYVTGPLGTFEVCLSRECPFTGCRKSQWSGQTDAIDPRQTKSRHRARSAPQSPNFYAHRDCQLSDSPWIMVSR
jgi:hypothetical protein